MSATTIHACAIKLIEIHDSVYHACGRKCCRTAAARRKTLRAIAARAVLESDDRPEVSSRDWREWRPNWDWSRPIMVGSGRAAEWSHQSYRWYAHLCQTLHAELGWSGARVRDAARALLRHHHGVGGAPAVLHPLPTRAMVRLVERARGLRGERGVDATLLEWERTHQRQGMDERRAVEATQWSLWMRHVFAPSWGEIEMRRTLYRLQQDSAYRAPSMWVGLIRHLRGDGREDYRGCSGCEDLVALADHPEVWDDVMARAPLPTPCRVGPIDAVAVPFGVRAPAEYDRVHTIGLSYEIRVRGSDYDRLSPAERSR